jgi:hypothetical protein
VDVAVGVGFEPLEAGVEGPVPGAAVLGHRKVAGGGAPLGEQLAGSRSIRPL